MKAIKTKNITKRSGGLIVTAGLNDAGTRGGEINIFLDEQDIELLYKHYIIVSSEIASILADIEGYNIPDSLSKKTWKVVIEYLEYLNRGQ